MNVFSKLVIALVLLGGCAIRSAPGNEALRSTIAAEEQLTLERSSEVRAKGRSALIGKYSALLNSGTLDANSQNEALFRRGRLYAEERKCSDAVADITRAINGGFRSAPAYLIRANCEILDGSLHSARNDLDEAIRLAPREWILYSARADLAQRQKNYGAAVQDLSRSVDLIKPDVSADLFERRGDAYMAEGMFERAVEDYNSAIVASNRAATQIMGSAPSRSAQLAPIYQKLSQAYAALARVSVTGR